jgi:hypothetical protein
MKEQAAVRPADSSTAETVQAHSWLAEQAVIVANLKAYRVACPTRLKRTVPLWIDGYEAQHGSSMSRARLSSLTGAPKVFPVA